MKYSIQSKDKESMVEFSKVKPGEVFSFFDHESLQRANHNVYMKMYTSGKNSYEHELVDLTDGKTYNFSEKKRVALNDPDESQANKVYVLNTKLNITI
jgi:hypothetical protein